MLFCFPRQKLDYDSPLHVETHTQPCSSIRPPA